MRSNSVTRQVKIGQKIHFGWFSNNVQYWKVEIGFLKTGFTFMIYWFKVHWWFTNMACNVLVSIFKLCFSCFRLPFGKQFATLQMSDLIFILVGSISSGAWELFFCHLYNPIWLIMVLSELFSIMHHIKGTSSSWSSSLFRIFE